MTVWLIVLCLTMTWADTPLGPQETLADYAEVCGWATIVPISAPVGGDLGGGAY